MELSDISPMRINLQDVCTSVLASRRERVRFYYLLKRDPDWISNNCYGSVDTETMNRLIFMSYMYIKLRVLLVQVVDALEGKDIKNNTFEKLLHYKIKSLRMDIWTALCHKKMNEYQLSKLCELDYAWECYYELAIKYYSGREYSLMDIENLFTRFSLSAYSYMKDDLVNELIFANIPSDMGKYDFVVEIIDEIHTKRMQE